MSSATGGEALALQLRHEGVRDVFGIPGVQLDAATDGLWQVRDDVRFVTARNEQSVTHMADGYARISGRPGVALVVPGPGALNALTGLATAYACGSPVLLIAAQIPSHAIGAGHGLLHELPDQTGLLRRLTAWSALADRPEAVAPLLAEAFARLRARPARPVALEVPQDVLDARGQIELVDPVAPDAPPAPDPVDLAVAAEVLRSARTPLIWAGGGAIGAATEVRRLAERLQAPVVMSTGGLGVLPSRHPLAMTPLHARAFVRHVDAVLVVGSRFIDRRAMPRFPAPDARFVYLNTDPVAFGPPRRPGVALHADAAVGLRALLAECDVAGGRPSRAAEVAAVRDWAGTQLRHIEPQLGWVSALRAALAPDAVLVTDLTQVGYVLPLAYPVSRPGELITPGYQGTLGYALPTAIGAALARPGSRVVVLSGDGGLGYALAELGTLARLNADVTVVVMADGRFGNVHRAQRQRFGRSLGTRLANPDFVRLADAFGVPAVRVRDPEGLSAALRESAATPGPALIEVPVGEMPHPWHLLIDAVAPPVPVAPSPLDGPTAPGVDNATARPAQ
ncbi:thiamine pyrophosphate-dependent enzyme [Dactylosporangium sp. CA-139114]|uniref:thiamine pyrophosphate-dependent enzyme n=1 Tax=Dactylosporangium sp. CA-139114 TaxID=3239931 RepID=UPI003D97AC97